MISYHGKMAGFFILSLPLHTLSLEAIHLNNKPSKPVWVSAVTFWGNCFPTEESYINSIVPQWMDGLPHSPYESGMTWATRDNPWKHFSHYWSFMRGILHWSLVDSPHKGPIMQSFDVGMNTFMTKEMSCQWFEKLWPWHDITNAVSSCH